MASTSALPGPTPPPASPNGEVSSSRKRSKWDEQAALEDELAIKIRRKNKIVAQERRRRERSAEAREREARLGTSSRALVSAPARRLLTIAWIYPAGSGLDVGRSGLSRRRTAIRAVVGHVSGPCIDAGLARRVVAGPAGSGPEPVVDLRAGKTIGTSAADVVPVSQRV